MISQHQISLIPQQKTTKNESEEHKALELLTTKDKRLKKNIQNIFFTLVPGVPTQAAPNPASPLLAEPTSRPALPAKHTMNVPGEKDALRGGILAAYSFLELFQTATFLELFNQTLDGLFRIMILTFAFLPAQ